MTIAALVVAVVAVLISLGSLFYVRRNTHAAEAADRRARQPHLAFMAEEVTATESSVVFTVRNDGPQDLGSLLVFRPRPPGGVTYPLAVLGGDFRDDGIELGPLDLNQTAKFVLTTGSSVEPPEFRVRVVARAGSDRWTLSQHLKVSRGPQIW